MDTGQGVLTDDQVFQISVGSQADIERHVPGNEDAQLARAARSTGPPETTKAPDHRGFLEYRYGDSNPGFRRERAAS